MANNDRDIAGLSLNIDASSVDKANASLGTFQSSARGATSASRDFGSEHDRLTRSIEQMIAAQRETNALLQQNLAAMRAVGTEVETQTRRMTQLTAGVGTATAAYELLGRRAQDTSRTMVQAHQDVANSIDAILQRMRALDQMRLGPLGPSYPLGQVPNVFSGIPGSPFYGGFGGGADASSMAIVQNALRLGISPGNMIGGANTGAILGVGDAAGASMVSRVQQNLNGFSDEALRARAVMQQFGATSTDAKVALDQFLAALSGYRDDPRRTAILQSVIPGADPSILTRTALGRINPQTGTYNYAQLQQANEAARLEGIIALNADRLQAAEEDRRRGLFGGSNVNLGNSSLMRMRDTELAQERQEFGLNASSMSWNDYLSGGVSNVGRQLRSDLSFFFGSSPPNIAAAPDTRAANGPTPAETALLREYEMRMGRMTPGAMQQRLADETMRGTALVKGGLLSQDDLDRDIRMLGERLERAMHPVEEMANSLIGQAALAGMDPASRQVAQVLRAGGQMARLAGQENGLTPAQELALREGVANRQTQSGSTLMRGTGQQIQQANELAAAYAEGGGSVARLTAAYQAHKEAIEGTINATQEASRASQLLSLSLATMAQREEQVLQQGRISNQAGAITAAGAAEGPAGRLRAQARAQVLQQFGNDLREAQAAGDPTAISDVERRMAEREQQLITDEQNRATEQRNLQRFQFNRLQRDMGSITGSAGGTQADTVIDSMLSHEGEKLARMCAALVNEALRAAGLPTSGSNLASSFRGYGSAVGAGQVQRGDIFYSGPSPGYTGHVGVVMGPAENGYVPVMSSHMQGAASNPAGVEYRSVAGLQFRRPAYGGSPGTPLAQEIISRQAAREAEQQNAGLGITDPAQNRERTRELLGTQLGSGIESAALRNRDNMQAVNDEMLRLQATVSGTVREQQAAEDQLKVDTEFRKLLQEAQAAEAAGLKGAVEQVNRLKESALGAANSLRTVQDQVAAARIFRQFGEQQQGVQREISALSTGGTAAYDIAARAEPIAKQLRDTGVYTPQEAQQLAEQMAKTAQAADDYKKAILDASNELKSGVKTGINDLVDGLTQGIQKGQSFGAIMSNVGLSLSKLGTDLFVKKPLEKLADNVISGNGFTFGSGGKSSGDIFSAAFSGIGKSFGKLFGSGDSSGSGDVDVGGGGFDPSSVSNMWGGGGEDAVSAGYFGDFAGVFHYGGVVGGGSYRAVSPAVFRGAPRMHTGGLLPDEVPVIAQRGERVLSRAETAAYDRGARPGGGGSVVYAPMHVHTSDADSFRRSEGQIAAAHRRSAERATRYL